MPINPTALQKAIVAEIKERQAGIDNNPATNPNMGDDYLNAMWGGVSFAIARFVNLENEQGGSGSEVSENLSTQVDGSRTVFNVRQPYASGTLRVYYNGVRQVLGYSIEEVSNTTFRALFVPEAGSILNCDYSPI